MSTSPWTAKLTEFDILKKVLPVSIWEIDREWQNKWKKKKAGNIKRESSSGIIWNESFTDGTLWLEKNGIPHAQDLHPYPRAAVVGLHSGDTDLEQTTSNLSDQELYPSLPITKFQRCVKG